MDNRALPREGGAIMQTDSDIVIAGGGLNGAALALALAQAGFRVIVADAQAAMRQAAPDFDGRAYAMAAGSVRLLRAIGVWGEVVAHAQPILHITVSQGRAGQGADPGRLDFDHAELDDGPMGYMVEDRYLRTALQGALAAMPGVTLLNGATVQTQHPDAGGIAVGLADGQGLTARLLVGADGRDSGTALRAGITRSGRDYGQTAIVCAVAHDRPHGGTAHQMFLPQGPLAILPLTGNRSSIVWTETTARATDIMALDDPGFLDALRPAFGSFLGQIALVGRRFAYPLTLSLAQRIVAERVALVGDAAHGVHPLAGQGLNAGLRDVAALVDVLGAARQRGEDIGTGPVLARYARWRGVDNGGLAAATNGFNLLFSNDNPVLRLGRGLGLAAVAALPPLRRALMREAAGLTGELPALMR